MIAKEKWQVRTIKVLDMVFAERVSQLAKHGEAMRELPDGTGPEVRWAEDERTAEELQEHFRREYDVCRAVPGEQYGQLTRMHLVREELAEAFELEGDDPEFLKEIIQVAALFVQWAEYKLEVRERIEAMI